MRILRARLYQMELERQQSELAGARRSQVGSGGRSEKIRTYNYKENRVTDHRIGLTLKRLDQVLEGDLDELITALSADEQATRLAEGEVVVVRPGDPGRDPPGCEREVWQLQIRRRHQRR